MGIADVRAGLETMLRSVAGINSASGWPTETVGALPFAYVGFNDDAVTMGNREIDLHELPIYVFVQRTGGNIVNQLKAVEELIEPLKTAIRANQHIGTPPTERVQYTRFTEGVFKHAQVDYLGFIAMVTIKESRGVTYA